MQQVTWRRFVSSALIYSLTFVAFTSEAHARRMNVKTREYVRLDDMILDREFIRESKASAGDFSTRAAAGFNIYQSKPWTDGVVPVAFDDSIPQTRRDLFMQLARNWSVGTGVRFVERSGQAEHLLVTARNEGCYSQVGAARGEARNLNLGEGCWYDDTIQHEVGHAIGLMHEHQRPDRDSFITINLQNVNPHYHSAFDRFWVMGTAESYDFLSIMHYDQWAFSFNNQRTIVTLPAFAEFQDVMGITTISASDRRVVAAVYPLQSVPPVLKPPIPRQDFEGFNEAYYLQTYPDVANAVREGWLTSGLFHYKQWGCREGRNPNTEFSDSYYRQFNPDVDAAVRAGAFESCAYIHFNRHGREEGRRANF